MAADGPDARNHMLNILSTIFTHWQYEREHRLFVGLNDKDGGHCFYNFNEDVALREIIVGAECDLSRAEVSNAVGDLLGAELSPSHFTRVFTRQIGASPTSWRRHSVR
jgi:hypothetical protein